VIRRPWREIGLPCVSVLAGRPIDERWQHINLEASTWVLGVSAIVVLAAFVAAQASRSDWTRTRSGPP
jgi:hypothetical protein